MAINKKWHLKNQMVKNATFDDRVKWHREHIKNCTCMPIPGKLLGEMKEKGIKI